MIAQIQSGAIMPTKNFAYADLALAVFVPVLVFWVFAYVAVWLYVWVRNGFRRDV